MRRRRDHVAMLEGKGVLLRGNKARDVSANLIRDGARHHRESWQGGRSTPVSATPLGVHTIRKRLEVGECGGDLLGCVVTVGQNDERVRCQQSRVHGKVRWAARMRKRIADCHDHTAEVAKLNILGNTADSQCNTHPNSPHSCFSHQLCQIFRWQLSPLLQTTDERDNADRQQATGQTKTSTSDRPRSRSQEGRDARTNRWWHAANCQDTEQQARTAVARCCNIKSNLQERSCQAANHHTARWRRNCR